MCHVCRSATAYASGPFIEGECPIDGAAQQPSGQLFVVLLSTLGRTFVFEIHRLQASIELPVALKAASAKFSHRLDETRRFGLNPGRLRMFTYTPSSLVERPALVVVLHGGGQSAAEYAHGAGWLTLADRYGFALLMPEQQRSNNPTGCFNWYQREDTQRGFGEAASIREMIEAVERDKNIDPRRILVTGLSAGGAMTSVLLACYPETFSAGAIIAGLPYGAARNVQEAFLSMYQCPSRPGIEWGGLVRSAAPQHNGPWPRVSVWHGNADRTVVPLNAREIVKQWIDVHELPDTLSEDTTAEGYPRQVWTNDALEQVVEYYSITDMAHGTPLATGGADIECGTAGPYLLEVGISSSFHIASFFHLTTVDPGLADAEPCASGPTTHQNNPDSRRRELPRSFASTPRQVAPERRTPPGDIGAVITAALKSAGLLGRG
jgi:feruloyl esterase